MLIFDTVQDLARAIESGPVTFTSKPQRLRRRHVTLQSLANGDFNPAHCQSRFAPHSIFKRVVSHGIGTIARAEGEFLQLLRFRIPPEVIATGIKECKYRSPLHEGDSYEYAFELTSCTQKGRVWKMECRIICKVTRPQERVVAEWIWEPAFVDHSGEVDAETLNLLQPTSYLRSVVNVLLINPISRVIEPVVLGIYAGIMAIGLIGGVMMVAGVIDMSYYDQVLRLNESLYGIAVAP